MGQGRERTGNATVHEIRSTVIRGERRVPLASKRSDAAARPGDGGLAGPERLAAERDLVAAREVLEHEDRVHPPVLVVHDPDHLVGAEGLGRALRAGRAAGGEEGEAEEPSHGVAELWGLDRSR